MPAPLPGTRPWNAFAIASPIVGYAGVVVLIAIFFVLRAFFGDYEVDFTW